MAGALVSVANSKPVTALLGPAFGALGGYWGERMQETVEGWRRKREANLREHVERVLGTEGPPTSAIPSEEQARLAAAWENAAQTVDPTTDEQLSSLWEGLLGRIYAMDGDAAALQQALMRLGPHEAKILLEFRDGSMPGSDLIETMAKLESLQLVRGFSILTHYRERPFEIMLPLLMIVAGYAFSSYAQLVPSLAEATPMFQVAMGMGPVFGVMLAIVGVSSVLIRAGRYRLTRLGKKLQSVGLRYASEGPKSVSPQA